VAVVTWPLSSGEARGRVGDLIYNSWRGISYVKAHAVHQNPFTEVQIQARYITSLCTLQWQAISDEQRSAWSHYAAEHLLDHWTGQPKRLTGYNWFVKLNWIHEWIWGGIIDDPPTTQPAYLFVNLAAPTPTSQPEVTWSPQFGSEDVTWAIDIWMEPVPYNTRSPRIKMAKMNTYAWDHNSHISLVDPPLGWIWIHVRAVHISGIAMPFDHFQVYVT
jgi:hypothetical protein